MRLFLCQSGLLLHDKRRKWPLVVGAAGWRLHHLSRDHHQQRRLLWCVKSSSRTDQSFVWASHLQLSLTNVYHILFCFPKGEQLHDFKVLAGYAFDNETNDIVLSDFDVCGVVTGQRKNGEDTAQNFPPLFSPFLNMTRVNFCFCFLFALFLAGETIRVTCANDLTGRYVAITIAGTSHGFEFLILCEVQVYGTKGKFT